MRILAAADIHGAQPVYEWLLGLSEGSADILVLAGDLFEGDFAAGQRDQAEKIIALLRTSRIPVLYIMGNDDNVPLDYEDKLIIPIHGRRVAIGNYNFVGYQYTPPFVGQEFVKEEKDIAVDLEEIEPMLDEQTVFVTHAPARGILDEVSGESVGSSSIGALLRRKRVLAHIHGHIHGGFGRSGNSFNVASAGQRRAMLIEIPALVHNSLNRSEVTL